MINFKSFLTVLFLVFSILGYGQYYYTPDNSSTLLLVHQKGDLKLSRTFPSYALNHTEIAYSPINKLSLKLAWFKHSTSKKETIPYTKGNAFSAAIGTYTFFKRRTGSASNLKSAHSSGILLDFYFGYTKGAINNVYASATSSKLNYQKIFGQLGLHYKSKFLSVGYALKISTLDYKNGSINGNPSNYEIVAINDEILVNDPYMLLETDMRITVGPPLINGYLQVSMINPNILDPSLLEDQDIVFSAGLVLGLDKAWSMIKKK